MAAPLVWVATELGRTYIFTGFPWVLLGYSQVTVLPIAQLASLFGVYGVSVLVAAVSAALASAASAGPRRRVRSGACRPPALADRPGDRRLGQPPRRRAASWTRAGEPIRVGLIQGNVDQAQKWDPARARRRSFSDYLQHDAAGDRAGRGARALARVVDAVPLRGGSPGGRRRSATLARQARVPILFGSDQIERGAPDRVLQLRVPGPRRRHDRRRLPQDAPGAVRRVRAAQAAAVLRGAAGRSSVGLLGRRRRRCCCRSDGHLVSTAICYEVVYPDLVRQFVAGGSELLTTITNDAWFGATSAPYQHFAQASMRAIENGRYLVRAANTGISGIVDPYGRVLGADARSFEPAVVVGEARFLADVDVLRADRRRVRVRVALVATLRCCWSLRRRDSRRVRLNNGAACRPSTS